MKDSLEILFQIFLKDDAACPPALREGVIDVVQGYINAAEDEFKNYSDQCLQMMLKYLGEILNKNINKNLVGPVMETISCIGPLSPELFKKYLITLVDTLIQINSNMPNFKENIAIFTIFVMKKILKIKIFHQR